MYVKLALRNARRCACDYYLYIITMTILAAVLQAANWTALTGRIRAGFETASLPLLIVLVLVLLADYCNSFLWKQRTKEFANYLLLGMERNRLSWMLFAEFLTIGMLCLTAGSLLGLAGCLVFCRSIEMEMGLQPVRESLTKTFFWFCTAELICGLRIRRRAARLQIRELMIEKKRNQKPGGRWDTPVWGAVFAGSMLCFMGFLCGIAFFPGSALQDMLISTIAVPLFLAVFSFYRWYFLMLAARRRGMAGTYRQDDGLYRIAQLTSTGKTGAAMNGIFCSCLLFSSASFGFGMLMLQPDMLLFTGRDRQWMGFLQISICIIFLVIYFSILSLQQLIELKQERENLRILSYMGRYRAEIEKLVRRQILVKLALPAVMCMIPLSASLPFIEISLYHALPDVMKHSILKIAGLYLFILLLLFLCYFLIVNAAGNKQIEKICTKREGNT